MTINGVSALELREKAGVASDASPSDAIIQDYARKVLCPYILQELPTEDPPDKEVSAYRALIERHGLKDSYQLSYPELLVQLASRQDLSVEEKLMILDLEDTRQLVLLDEEFPAEESENTDIRQHLRALNQLQRHLFQGSDFDQPGAALSGRAESLGFHQMIRGRGYTLTTKDGVLTFSTSASLQNLVRIDEEEHPISAPTSPSGEAQPCVDMLSRYTLTASSQSARFGAELHTLNVNTKEASGFKKPSSLETLYRNICEYIKNQRQEIASPHHCMVSTHDPLMVVGTADISESEKALKRDKILVLTATKSFIAAEVDLNDFCRVLAAHPNWSKGSPSRAYALVSKALESRNITETQLSQAMLLAKLEHAITRTENRLHSLSDDQQSEIADNTKLIHALKVAKNYHLDKADADDLEAAQSPLQEKKLPEWKLIEKVIKQKSQSSTPSIGGPSGG